MKTTVELPDDLYRRAKAVAALRGIRVRDLVEEGLRRALEASPGERMQPRLAELMEDACGLVDSGVPDLASDPRHLEGFGGGGRGDR